MKQKGGKHLIKKSPGSKRRLSTAGGSHVVKASKPKRLYAPEDEAVKAEAAVSENTVLPAEESRVYEVSAASKEKGGFFKLNRKQEPAAEKQARPRRKGLIAAGAVLLVLALLVGSVYFFVDSKLNKITYDPVLDTPMKTGKEFTVVTDDYELNTDGLEQRESGGALPTDDVFADDNVINILLLGTDMKIPGTEDPGRCDLTMLCSLNKKSGDIKLVGFERTIGVPVPGYEDEMLSYVFQYGGGEFMQETINKCFLVDIAGYVHVSYEMFPQVIDAIGGIEVELDQSEVYYMSEYLAYDPAKETLHTGLCKLNGTAAYSFCRLRDPDDDWGRQARVREAVAAMVAKLKTLTVKDINSMADTVLPMISTNLTKAEIKSLMAMAPKFVNAEVSQLMIPEQEGSWTYVTGRGAYMLGCDYTACAQEIKQFIYE